MHQSDYIEGKVTYTVIWKMKLKLGWKFLINPSFLRSFFFQSAIKNFLLAIWSCSRYVKGVFNLVLCARKKKLWAYDKYFKIYSKKLTPLTPLRGLTALTQFCATCFKTNRRSLKRTSLDLWNPIPKTFVSLINNCSLEN